MASVRPKLKLTQRDMSTLTMCSLGQCWGSRDGLREMARQRVGSMKEQLLEESKTHKNMDKELLERISYESSQTLETRWRDTFNRLHRLKETTVHT